MNQIQQINSDGFIVINNIYSETEIAKLICVIEKNTENKSKNSTFRMSDDLFAIRQFLGEIPEILDIVLNDNLKRIVKSNFGNDYFITKSIYFDKPEMSNWFVAYHQDLTISVNKKIDLENYKHWTIKQNQFAVQPPKDILEGNFTIRIHLDKTTKENGALKVVNKSHLKGICRIESVEINDETETFCEVENGGIMIMKPLLFHASNKTINNERRRVIHIEFSNQELPKELEWNERINFTVN